MNTFYGIEQTAQRRIAELRKQKAEITLGAMVTEQNEASSLVVGLRWILLSIRRRVFFVWKLKPVVSQKYSDKSLTSSV